MTDAQQLEAALKALRELAEFWCYTTEGRTMRAIAQRCLKEIQS
jgi:hypothetical protein